MGSGLANSAFSLPIGLSGLLGLHGFRSRMWISANGTGAGIVVHNGTGGSDVKVDGIGCFTEPSSSDMTTGVSSSEIIMLWS